MEKSNRDRYTYIFIKQLISTTNSKLSLQLFQVESQLRKLSFGYRAKFIQKSASQIVEWGGVNWFSSLQDMQYKDARQELMKLHGIGPKVNRQWVTGV